MFINQICIVNGKFNVNNTIVSFTFTFNASWAAFVLDVITQSFVLNT